MHINSDLNKFPTIAKIIFFVFLKKKFAYQKKLPNFAPVKKPYKKLWYEKNYFINKCCCFCSSSGV